MTRQEILNTPEIVDFMIDKSVIVDSKMKLHKRLEELCKLAIKALEQQSCEDCISRKQALKETKALIRGDYDPEYIIETLKMLPSVTPKALEQQPCEDCISRADVKKYLSAPDANGDRVIYESDLDLLPPVTPKPKIGHWIEKNGFDGDTYYDCSECGESFCLIDGTPTDNLYNYCPNCGAKMSESEE